MNVKHERVNVNAVYVIWTLHLSAAETIQAVAISGVLLCKSRIYGHCYISPAKYATITIKR